MLVVAAGGVSETIEAAVGCCELLRAAIVLLDVYAANAGASCELVQRRTRKSISKEVLVKSEPTPGRHLAPRLA